MSVRRGALGWAGILLLVALCWAAPQAAFWADSWQSHGEEIDCCCGSQCFMACSLDARASGDEAPLRWIPTSPCAESCASTIARALPLQTLATIESPRVGIPLAPVLAARVSAIDPHRAQGRSLPPLRGPPAA
ncbi:MAG: hypothetical protein AAGD01_07030 [Acidobacteriota bacterium]